MKKLFLFLAFFVSINAYSQLDSLQKQAERLTAEKIYSDVKQGFSNLVKNLEGPAKHVYKIYIFQHKTEGIVFMFVPIVFLTFGLILTLKNYKKADFGDGNKAAFASGAGIIASVVGIVTTIVFFICYLTKVINPEYYAIQDIIKAFK